MERFRLAGKGSVYTYSVVHEVPSELDMQKPYVIAMIEMDEGAKLTAQVIDVDPKDVHIGMRVRATLRRLGDEGPDGIIHYGYKFVPILN